MTKADIAKNVMGALDCSFNEAVEHVEATLEVIKQSLEKGQDVKIARFGNFMVKDKADRQGRNPQTGDTITIASRRIVTFKPSTVLKLSMNPA